MKPATTEDVAEIAGRIMSTIEGNRPDGNVSICYSSRNISLCTVRELAIIANSAMLNPAVPEVIQEEPIQVEEVGSKGGFKVFAKKLKKKQL